MNQLPIDFLHNPMITKDNMKTLIHTTFDVFDTTNSHQLMKDALLSMVDTNALIWTLQHFLRECEYQNWNLAIIFAEQPKEYKSALENNDILGYYANLNNINNQ